MSGAAAPVPGGRACASSARSGSSNKPETAGWSRPSLPCWGTCAGTGSTLAPSWSSRLSEKRSELEAEQAGSPCMTEIEDIPHLPDRQQRLDALMVDCFGRDEELS